MDIKKEFIKAVFKSLPDHKDNMGMKGKVKLELFDADGKLVETRVIHNTITNAGDKIAADAFSDRGDTLPTHMAVGTTSGGKTAASTALESELARVALTSTTQGTGADDNDVVYVATFPAGTGTGALVEAGIFNAGAGGDMIAYQEFGVINKTASMSLQITWTVTFGAS